MNKRKTSLSVALAALLGALGAALALTLFSSAATSVTVNASADAWVDAANPSVNHGADSRFRLDGSPVANDLFRFTVPASSQAVLWLYAGSTGSGFDVHLGTGGWTETGVNYSNAPTIGPVVAHQGSFAANTWTTTDVSAAVAGGGTFTFVLTNSSVTNEALLSRESMTVPHLVLTTNAGTTTTGTTTTGTTSTGTTSTVPTGGDKTIVAAGDIACDPSSNSGAPSNCDHLGTSKLFGGANAVLTLGDNQYEVNALSAYQAVFDPSWGAAIRALGIPIHPSIGNHEYLTANASGYFSYFGAAAGDPSKGYYSYDLGAWHFLSLNSECSHIGGCGAGTPEETWVKADLAAHPAFCTLAYWHEPRFSSGEHGDATQMVTIWNDLVAAHADVVLSGHNHDYERYDMLGATTATQPVLDPNGVREFVAGTGGKNHYSFGTVPPQTGEQIRNANTFGVLRLVLHPTGYDWKFVNDPASGVFTDSGSGVCH